MAEDKQGPSLTQPAPRWLVKVAVGMVLIIVVVTIAKLLIADPSPSIGTSGPTVTELALPDAANAKCRVPDVELLKAQSLAFEGTATAIVDRQVTLEVERWFNGNPTRLVTVEAVSPQMLLALSGVDFEVGQRYLVSATDGQVTLCGFSAEYNRELAGLYEEAYVS